MEVLDAVSFNISIPKGQRVQGKIDEFATVTPSQADVHQFNAVETISRYYVWEVTIYGTILGLIVLTTILGNLLVCVTIFKFRSLQTNTNYFVLSLAFSDLFLGILVLPFSSLNTLAPKWPLGYIFCNIYISTDVMLCTVSILNLFAISLERYFAVALPLKYARVVTRKKVYIVLLGIWLFSFVISFVPIHLGWNTADGRIQNMDSPTTCLFINNKIYVLLVAVSTYFIPLLVMCIVYIKVLHIARSQVKQINQLVKSTIRIMRPDNAEKNSEKKQQPKLASDSKATVTLASVVTAFAICWIPYFTVFMITPFLQKPIPIDVEMFVLWLGYVNSMFNPFLYGFHNTLFREAFLKILCPKNSRYVTQNYPTAV